MHKLSVLIPSRNERFLAKTIDDLFAKAVEEIEVIVTLDGYEPFPQLIERPGLILIRLDAARGMRNAINLAAGIATGKFLMKIDAHCMVGEGFDKILKSDCDDNWMVIPRRCSLDPENWVIARTGKAPVDYHYLCYPYRPDKDVGLHGEVWKTRAVERAHIMIDDEMSSQGSCWFMTKDHFVNRIGTMDEAGYGKFVQEAQELGLKTWLGGGRMVINKNTWYAHLHKGKTYGRGYFIDKREMKRGAHFSADYWLNNRWSNRVRDFEWLIDHFMPVPTWPANWRELGATKSIS